MWVALLILSVVLIIVGTFELIAFDNPKINGFINAVGFILNATYFSKIFWYKNYVQWNDKGILIKINSFIGKSISFKDITGVRLDGKELIITKTNQIRACFDLSHIIKSDVEKLYQIIDDHSLEFSGLDRSRREPLES